MDEPKVFKTFREGGPLEVNRCPECGRLASAYSLFSEELEMVENVTLYRCHECMVEWLVKYKYRRVEHPGAPEAVEVQER